MSEINTEIIEDIKTELVLKMLQGTLTWRNIENLPKNDELRSFICKFRPISAYSYALYVDKAPSEETRIAASKDPMWAYYYARNIDKKSSDETRIAVSKDSFWDSCYKKWEQKNNEKHRRY